MCSAEVLANATAVSYPRFPNCLSLTPQQVDEVSFLVRVLPIAFDIDLIQQLAAVAGVLCV